MISQKHNKFPLLLCMLVAAAPACNPQQQRTATIKIQSIANTNKHIQISNEGAEQTTENAQEKYIIRYRNNDEQWQSFEISGAQKNGLLIDPISKTLHDKARSGATHLQNCFESTTQSGKLIDISFDISGSVRNSLVKSDIGYELESMSLIRKVLDEQNIRPNDKIRIHFFGANTGAVAERNREFIFSGPNFSCNLDFQLTKNCTFVDVTNVTFPEKKWQGGAILVSTTSDLMNEIEEFYSKTISIKNSTGSTTLLSKHLNELFVSENVDGRKRFSSAIYIIQSDGISNDGYVPLRNSPYTNSVETKIYFIGLKRSASMSEDVKLEERIRHMFPPTVEVIFLN